MPQDAEGYDAGGQVSVQLLRPLEEIERTLVITGSHDPLIDETAELMRRKWHAPAGIYGYEREEFTHTAVAALVASGSADAGLGIRSAAGIYGLDFIPVCTEQYDFLLLEDAYGLPAVRRWLETMQSPGFTERLMRMGGYEFGRPGTIKEF